MEAKQTNHCLASAELMEESQSCVSCGSYVRPLCVLWETPNSVVDINGFCDFVLKRSSGLGKVSGSGLQSAHDRFQEGIIDLWFGAAENALRCFMEARVLSVHAMNQVTSAEQKLFVMKILISSMFLGALREARIKGNENALRANVCVIEGALRRLHNEKVICDLNKGGLRFWASESRKRLQKCVATIDHWVKADVSSLITDLG